MTTKSRGTIHVLYTVMCAKCDENLPVDELVDDIKEAAQEARQEGWIKSRAHGWLCPECQVKMKRGE